MSGTQTLRSQNAAAPTRVTIGAQTFGLGEINDALSVAASMAIPKALVDPWQSDVARVS